MDTRIIIVVDVFVVFASLGAIWLVVANSQQGIPTGYDAFDVFGMVGGYVGGHQVNPSNYTQTDYGAFIWALLPPVIVGSWALDAALIAVPLALVLAVMSLARWQLALPAGIIGILGGTLWVSGVSSISQEAGARLSGWQGFYSTGPQSSVSASLGPYMIMAGGRPPADHILPDEDRETRPSL